MKSFIRLGFGLLAIGPALAQMAASEAALKDARQELETTQDEYNALRGALYREIDQLDDEAIKLSKELRELEREEAMRTSRLKTTEQNTQILRTNFDYATSVLRQYGDNLVNRLHNAENQLYRDALSSLAEQALAAKDDPRLEMETRLRAVDAGLARLAELAGGQRFEGKAMRNGTEAKEGQFLLMGPAGYFRAQDGSFEGVTVFEDGGTGYPTVVGVAVSEHGQITGTVNAGRGALPFDPTLGKALQVQAAEESLLDVIKKGGIVGHAILALGALALMLTLFKVWEISRFPVPSRRLINEVIDDLLSDRQDAAARKVSKLQGMSGDMVRTGVERFYQKRRVLEEALFEKLVAIKPMLERFLPFLGLTAAAAPLMGLLGTVLGIIKTFKAMALDSGNKQAFTVGISEALITTAEGLVVAIPVLVLHGLMKSLAKGKFGEIESIGISLLNGTTELGGATKASMGQGDGPGGPEDEDDDTELELTPSPA